MKPILEALLFASDKPLTVAQLARVLDGTERKALHQALDELRGEYDREARGFKLVEVAEGWQATTRPEHAASIRKLSRARSGNRLSRPSLETLAIVAYRQPITKPEIEAIRGVNADGVLYSLLERRVVRTVGRKDVAGRPLLYGTTREFLQMFGLKDLGELPRLAELKDLLKQDSAGEQWELDENGALVEKRLESRAQQSPVPQAEGGEGGAGGNGPEGADGQDG
jgi:segregation and condensation protein B